MSPRTYRRGLAGRVVETVVEFHRIDDAAGDVADPETDDHAGRKFEWIELEESRQAALLAENGPLAWLARVEGAAGEVLTAAGYRVDRDRLGLHIVPDGKPLPDVNALDSISWAARVVEHVRCARIVLAGENVLAAFEWGAKLAQAAQGLKLELAGWPMAAHWGRSRKGGHDSTIDAERRARTMRWYDKVERADHKG